jgi:hypothetical protein
MTSASGSDGEQPPAPSRTRAVDELADLLRPAVQVTRRRLPDAVAGIALLITVLAVLALVGAAVDDHAIERNPGVAQAEVLDGSSFDRTLVRFTVANGEAVVPALGVYYPGGLQVGQTVAVEYDVTDPAHVRVAGRTALGSALPLVLITIGAWVVLGPLALWLRRRRVLRRA